MRIEEGGAGERQIDTPPTLIRLHLSSAQSVERLISREEEQANPEMLVGVTASYSAIGAVFTILFSLLALGFEQYSSRGSEGYAYSPTTGVYELAVSTAKATGSNVTATVS